MWPEASKTYFIAVVGNCCVDVIYSVPEFLQGDAKTEAREMHLQGGGPAANAAVALSRLQQRVWFFGQVADDSFGDFLRTEFEKEGINVEGLIQSAPQTRISSCIVESGTGRRQIFAKSKLPEMPTGTREMIQKQPFHALVLDGHEMSTALHAAETARARNIPVFTGLGSVRPHCSELIQKSTWVIVSEKFARQSGTTDDGRAITEELCRSGPQGAVLTLGERGSIGYAGSRHFFVATPAIEAVDTTGAGDAYLAGFTFAILQGRRFQESMQFASAVAAHNCLSIGGRAGLPHLEDLARYVDWFRQSENESRS